MDEADRMEDTWWKRWTKTRRGRDRSDGKGLHRPTRHAGVGMHARNELETIRKTNQTKWREANGWTDLVLARATESRKERHTHEHHGLGRSHLGMRP